VVQADPAGQDADESGRSLRCGTPAQAGLVAGPVDEIVPDAARYMEAAEGRTYP
jgi:hypothetical protein